MADPGGTVRIRDLADPLHPAHVTEILRGAEKTAHEMQLDSDWLCARAVEETGLSDFGSEDFRDRLAWHLESLAREGRLSAMGRIGRCNEMLRFLKNRLLVEDQIARNPEILEIEIARPIVITGFPRTGTTHLHNSLAADPELRELPYWEALEPVSLPAEEVLAGDVDPRRERCQAAVEFVNRAMPHFPKMHEMTVDHAHEEIDLLALDFSTMWFETPGPLWQWIEGYKKSDQTPHYRYLHRVLQVLTFLRGGERWVLKSPQHFEQFGPLLKVFPDATLVVTHRDPLPVIASFATMLTYTARLMQKRPNPAAYGRYAFERMSDLLDACMRDRALWPDSQSLDLRFQDFVADQDAALEAVYAVAGQSLSEVSRRAVAEYVDRHPPGRHGRIHYDLHDFELDPEALRERFQPYCERFALRAET